MNRVINDQISWTNGVDGVRIAAEFVDSVAHSGEIDECRDTGEVLQDHSGRFEGNFDALSIFLVDLPVENLFDVGLCNMESITITNG